QAPPKRYPEARPARNRSHQGSASSDRRNSARSSESSLVRTSSDTRRRDPRKEHTKPLPPRPHPSPRLLRPADSRPLHVWVRQGRAPSPLGDGGGPGLCVCPELGGVVW